MKCSEQTNEIFSALSKAQADIKPAKLDCYNTFLKSGYSSLGALQDVYKEPLAKHGLTLMQFVENLDTGGFQLNTMLGHSSGQSLSTTFRLILPKEDMQGLGSSITYARRYAISALLGIVDSSDDGVNAQGITAAKQEYKEKAKEVLNKKVDELSKGDQAFKEAVARSTSPGGTIAVSKLAEELARPKKPVKNYAPGASNVDIPEPKRDEIAEAMFRPSEYKVEFGKYKGKVLKDLGPTVVKATLEWIEKDTVPPRTKSLVNFLDYGKMYLNEVGAS